MNGNKGLQEITAAVRKYCALPSDHDYVAVALWVAHTHFVEAFDYAPRLVIRSPHKGSGKTRLLEIVAELVHGPLKSVNASTPAVFRSLETRPGTTLIFDEVDTIFGTASRTGQNEDLRGILNAGFQRGASVQRMGGANFSEVQTFRVFAPAALAGIGRLPDTIEDRAVVIPVRRRAPNEQVAPYRTGRDSPELQAIRDRLGEWATANVERARDYVNAQQFVIPVDDRAADVWEPLLVVADLAGGLWPQLSREACLALVARASEADAELDPGRQLLSDIREVFVGEFMYSDTLIGSLLVLPETPWASELLNAHRLGKKLHPYGIKSRRDASGDKRGYRRMDFIDAWIRYVPGGASDVSDVSETHAERRSSSDELSDSRDDLALHAESSRSSHEASG